MATTGAYMILHGQISGIMGRGTLKVYGYQHRQLFTDLFTADGS